jgi:hypothetical protein
LAGLGREGRNCVEEILRRCGEQKLFGGDVSRIDKRYLRLLKRLKALPDKAFLETWFRDSAFLSGDCVEDYCNTLFCRNKKTKQML